ncbi:PREDICTED: recQ-mediated genome instability protein 1 [Chrysochloris asiatica]|uniref:RecQ-mediated genome instability protein 1 n=1 Tax=Chrysochloris asiatica TaxID=185453 RepID=A0A9B0WHF2_CHRAS|nr:PREDICTED: recQ-mediated genome instability protein 1 [Chrysochloris asiatica]
MSVTDIALRVETWLFATWHVKVPVMWLEACINWIQEENNNVKLSQAQINKQVFEQWLLTDLRDLEHPLLPDGILEVSKGELNGFYALQINSLVDVSQPAYSQIQKLRGTNTRNDLVTAETQVPQKPWEAKPSRMLMLQITDGITQMQGMEYQSIPALHSDLPPGTKILIYGNISFRLGVLLLKPENVKVLGGEVDALLEEYAQEKVLARLIGELDSMVPVIPNNSNQSIPIPRTTDILDPALGPSDEELLASLGENDELVANNDTLERGYFITGSSSNNKTTRQSCFEPGFVIPPGPTEESLNQFMHLTDEELDDFSLEEVLLLEESVQKEQLETTELHPLALNKNTDKSIEEISHKSNTLNNFSFTCKNENSNWNEKNVSEQIATEDKSFDFPSAREQNSSDFSVDHYNLPLPHDFTNKDNSQADNKVKEAVSSTDKHSLDGKVFRRELVNYVPKRNLHISNENDYHLQSCSLRSLEKSSNLSVTMDLYSPPFIYLSVLMARKPKEVTVVKIKAFIVTLTGNLTSSGGVWNVTAKISDGTAYLDVDFEDEILTSLIGYSVAEMKQLKKDPLEYQKFREGLQKCQRDLIDLCCLMTISFNPSLSKAVVLSLQDVNMEHLENLKKRLNK